MKQGNIQITYGIGRGKTCVAAYHAALRQAAIHEYNFEGERVIIPKNTQVKVLEPDERVSLSELGNAGDLLHIALARSYGSQAGREYFAGLGWALDQDNSGFIIRSPGIDPVELYTEKDVRELIEKGIESIKDVEDPNRKWNPLEQKVLSVRSDGNPVSVVVAAVYSTQLLPTAGINTFVRGPRPTL